MGKSKKKESQSDSDSESSSSEEDKRKKKKTNKKKSRQSDSEESESGRANRSEAAKTRERGKDRSDVTSGNTTVKKEEGEKTNSQSSSNIPQKSGRRRNIRQTKTALESDEDNEAVATNLEEAKLIQKARRRGMGVCWTADDGQELDKEEQELKSVVHGSATGGLVSANAMAFQTKAEEVDEKVASAKAKFIEAELNKIRMGDKNYAKQTEENTTKVSKKSFEDELYEIPAFLKQEKEEIEESGDRWLTGIAEVPLPMGVKLSNIERTERAKQEHFAQAKGQVALNVAKNVSSNFKKHKEDWVKAKKDESAAYKEALARKDGHREGMAVSQPKLPLPPSGFASDDKVLDRFVKRYKYK